MRSLFCWREAAAWTASDPCEPGRRRGQLRAGGRCDPWRAGRKHSCSRRRKRRQGMYGPRPDGDHPYRLWCFQQGMVAGQFRVRAEGRSPLACAQYCSLRAGGCGQTDRTGTEREGAAEEAVVVVWGASWRASKSEPTHWRCAACACVCCRVVLLRGSRPSAQRRQKKQDGVSSM